MKKMLKKLLVVVVALVILFGTGVPFVAAEADTAKISEQDVRTKLKAFYKKHPNKSKWTDTFDGAKECYGFGKLVINNLFGKTDKKQVRTWHYDGTGLVGMKKIGGLEKLTKDNVKWLLAYAQPGDVIQFRPWIENGKPNGHQHTMIVWDIDENGVTIYDCNRSTDTVLREYKTWKQIADMQKDKNGKPKRGAVSLLRATNAESYGDTYTSYETHGTVQVKKATALKTFACNQKTNARSLSYTTLQPGTKVEVIRLVQNEKGNYWYEVSYDGKTELYLYSNDVTWISWDSSDITKKNVSVPSGNVAACKDVKLKGSIEAKYNRLSRIESSILMGSKVPVKAYKNLNKAKSVSIGDDALKGVNISKLNACGSYKYSVTVECVYYYADGNKLAVKTGSKNVILSEFFVK